MIRGVDYNPTDLVNKHQNTAERFLIKVLKFKAGLGYTHVSHMCVYLSHKIPLKLQQNVNKNFKLCKDNFCSI